MSMSLEQKVRSAIRWHSSFVADAALSPIQTNRNKDILQSEEDTVNEILRALNHELQATAPTQKGAA